MRCPQGYCIKSNPRVCYPVQINTILREGPIYVESVTIPLKEA